MAQLMSAVVAVLSESLTESIKGFYKLRKAYVTLDGLVEAESAYMRSLSDSGGAATPTKAGNKSSSGSPLRQSFEPDNSEILNERRPGTSHRTAEKSKLSQNVLDDDKSQQESDLDEEDDFQDADEVHEKGEVLNKYVGHIDMDGTAMQLENAKVDPPKVQSPSYEGWSSYFSSSNRQPEQLKRILSHDPDSDVFENPIDVFVHSGTNLCYGLLLLLLSLIPPAFGKLLQIIGFRGDRERGLKMLWQASKFHNINGAMAGLVILGYYNGLVGFCDILPDTKTNTSAEENIQGYPIERLEGLLLDMRTRFPKSKLWRLEEARMEAARRNLSGGLTLLSSDMAPPLKQVHALAVFERSLQAMYAHDYTLCAKSFQECCDLNNWSHALYLYIAGTAHVELYRRALATSDEKAAGTHAREATKLLQSARQHAGKKKFMARQLPFDVFVVHKLDKWTARAQQLDVPFVDAIAVSPLEEMLFFWSGHKKMDAAQLDASLAALAWGTGDADGTAGEARGQADEPPDERAIRAVLRAATLRAQRRHEAAAALLQAEVLSLDRALFRGHLRDDWTSPTAHYEMAANLWAMREDGERPTARDRRRVREAEEWLGKAARWEGYMLDARVGLKVTTGLDTVRRWRAVHDP